MLATPAGSVIAQTAPASDAPATVTAPASDGLVVRGSKDRSGQHCYTTGGQPAIGSLIPRKPKVRKCAETAEERRLLAQNRHETDRDTRELVRPMGGSIAP